MTKPTSYSEAVNQLKKAPRKGSFLLIEFGYNLKLVLPYAAGVTLMNTLEEARALEGFGDDLKLTNGHKQVQISPYPSLEMEMLQIAEMFNLTLPVVREMYEQQKQQGKTP